MRAVVVSRTDGPEALEVTGIPDVRARDDQVLIEVKAAGVNYPDLLLTLDKYQYKPELPFVLGGELAGVVRHAPEGSGFRAGDRVAATSTLGAFAELAAVPAETVYALPDTVTFAAGACLPMNYLTLSFALGTRGRLEPGETVLVHGAAGGIGTAAVQLAAALGATVVAVVSSRDKAEFVRSIGAHEVVPAEGFKDAVTGLLGERAVDVVVDPVGGDRFTDSLRCLSPLGRLLVIGFTAGDIPTVKVNRLLLGNLDVRGVGWGAYASAGEGRYRAEWDRLVPLLESGLLDPPISGTFALDEAPEAVAMLAERKVLGKLVVEPGRTGGECRG